MVRAKVCQVDYAESVYAIMPDAVGGPVRQGSVLAVVNLSADWYLRKIVNSIRFRLGIITLTRSFTGCPSQKLRPCCPVRTYVFW